MKITATTVKNGSTDPALPYNNKRVRTPGRSQANSGKSSSELQNMYSIAVPFYVRMGAIINLVGKLANSCKILVDFTAFGLKEL